MIKTVHKRKITSQNTRKHLWNGHGTFRKCHERWTVSDGARYATIMLYRINSLKSFPNHVHGTITFQTKETLYIFFTIQSLNLIKLWTVVRYMTRSWWISLLIKSFDQRVINIQRNLRAAFYELKSRKTKYLSTPSQFIKETKSFENNKRSDTVCSHPHELMDYQLQMYLVKETEWKLFGIIVF